MKGNKKSLDFTEDSGKITGLFEKGNALVAQWIRALACGARGRVFESRRGRLKNQAKCGGKFIPPHFCLKIAVWQA